MAFQVAGRGSSAERSRMCTRMCVATQPMLHPTLRPTHQQQRKLLGQVAANKVSKAAALLVARHAAQVAPAAAPHVGLRVSGGSSASCQLQLVARTPGSGTMLPTATTNVAEQGIQVQGSSPLPDRHSRAPPAAAALAAGTHREWLVQAQRVPLVGGELHTIHGRALYLLLLLLLLNAASGRRRRRRAQPAPGRHAEAGCLGAHRQTASPGPALCGQTCK